MARRHSHLLFALVLGIAVFAMPSTPSSAQGDTSTTTIAPAPEETQTLVDGGPDTESRVASESRRVLALIGGLVLVAVALTLLTIRYWRFTRPVAVAADGSPEPVGAEVSRRSRRAVAGADHAGAGEDWEPRGTGEHTAVGVPVTLPKPSLSSRRRALGLSAED